VTGGEWLVAEKRRNGRDFIAQMRAMGAAVLSAQADTFAGTNVKEKAPACSVRNDGVGWAG